MVMPSSLKLLKLQHGDSRQPQYEHLASKQLNLLAKSHCKVPSLKRASHDSLHALLCEVMGKVGNCRFRERVLTGKSPSSQGAEPHTTLQCRSVV